MTRLVHARLDTASVATLKRLRQRTGLNNSDLIRSGLRALENSTPAALPRRIIGLGAFDSGIHDLGSNKKHLEGYGR